MKRILLALAVVIRATAWAESDVPLLPSDRDPVAIYERARDAWEEEEYESLAPLLEQLADQYQTYELKNRTSYLRGIVLMRTKVFPEAVRQWSSIAARSLSDDERMLAEYHAAAAELQLNQFNQAYLRLRRLNVGVAKLPAEKVRRAIDRLMILSHILSGETSDAILFQNQLFGTQNRDFVAKTKSMIAKMPKAKDEMDWMLTSTISSETRRETLQHLAHFPASLTPEIFPADFDLPKPNRLKANARGIAAVENPSSDFEINVGAGVGYLTHAQADESIVDSSLYAGIEGSYRWFDEATVRLALVAGLTRLTSSYPDPLRQIYGGVDLGYGWNWGGFRPRFGIGAMYQGLFGARPQIGYDYVAGPLATLDVTLPLIGDTFLLARGNAALLCADRLSFNREDLKIGAGIYFGLQYAHFVFDRLLFGLGWERTHFGSFETHLTQATFTVGF